MAEETLEEREKRLEQIQREIELVEKVSDEHKTYSTRLETIIELSKQRATASESERKRIAERIIAQKKLNDELLLTAIEEGRITQEEFNRIRALHAAREKHARWIEEQKKAREEQKKQLEDLNSLTEKLTGLNVKSLTTVKGLAGAFYGLALQLDEAQIQLGRLTGYVETFKADITDTASRNAGMAISLQESSKAISDLLTGFTLFATLSKSTQEDLEDLTVQFERLGVSGEAFAKTQELLTRGMGMSAEGAIAATMRFDELGQKIGLPTQQIISDFTAIGPKMARFGVQGEAVFVDLMKEARKLGITTQQAFDITEAFDTFESAADLAGKLNAQIGLQLNSVQMMNAEHGDRLRILTDEFKMRGKNFDDMNRRQRQAIAEVLGVDEDFAKKLFGDPVALRAYQKEQKEISERAAKLTSITQKLQTSFQQLALAMKPLLDAFLWTIDFVVTLLHIMPDWMKTLLGVAIAVTAVVRSLMQLKKLVIIGTIVTGIGKVLTFLTAGLAGLAVKGPLAAAGVTPVGPALTLVGKGALAGAKGLLILMGVLTAAAALVWALKEFVLAFGEIGENAWPAAAGVAAFGAAMMMASIGVGMMGAVSAATGWAIAAVALAAVAMGAGIWLAAQGLSVLVDSFTGFVAAAGDGTAAFVTLGLAMLAFPVTALAFAWGLKIAAAASFTGVAAFGLLALTVVGLAGSLALLSLWFDYIAGTIQPVISGLSDLLTPRKKDAFETATENLQKFLATAKEGTATITNFAKAFAFEGGATHMLNTSIALGSMADMVQATTQLTPNNARSFEKVSTSMTTLIEKAETAGIEPRTLVPLAAPINSPVGTGFSRIPTSPPRINEVSQADPKRQSAPGSGKPVQLLPVTLVIGRSKSEEVKLGQYILKILPDGTTSIQD